MTKAPNLVQLKIAVIKFHDANQYLEVAIARDACFTSHNAVTWKENQLSDTVGEVKALMPQKGQEITDVKLDKLLTRCELIEAELLILQTRHDADKEVYKIIAEEHGATPAVWSHKPKRTFTSEGHGIDSRLAKFGLVA
jgi:hypothetical protein